MVILDELLFHLGHLSSRAPALGVSTAFVLSSSTQATTTSAQSLIARNETSHIFPAAHDIENRRRSNSLQILDQRSSAPSKCLRAVNAFSRKVVELFVMGIEDDFFLIGVFKGLRAFNVRDSARTRRISRSWCRGDDTSRAR